MIKKVFPLLNEKWIMNLATNVSAKQRDPIIGSQVVQKCSEDRRCDQCQNKLEQVMHTISQVSL